MEGWHWLCQCDAQYHWQSQWHTTTGTQFLAFRP